jgi:hypothetical protein
MDNYNWLMNNLRIALNDAGLSLKSSRKSKTRKNKIKKLLYE